jgi:hypothetical protein
VQLNGIGPAARAATAPAPAAAAPPPPRPVARTAGDGDSAQENLEAMAGRLGVDPDALLHQLMQGMGSTLSGLSGYGSAGPSSADGGVLVDRYA